MQSYEHNHYTNLKIPIWNLSEILKTQDYSLLNVEDVRDSMPINAPEIWKSIYNQYCDAAEIDNRNLKITAKINELKKKHYEITLLLSLATDTFPEVRKQAREVLAKKYNYIIRKDKSILEELKRLKSQLDSLYTKIRIEENKLPKEQKKEGMSLMKQVIIIEDASPGISIDVYTYPTEKYLARMKALKIKARNQKRKKAA